MFRLVKSMWSHACCCCDTYGRILRAHLTACHIRYKPVFDWPGLGMLTIEAIQQRDYPLVQGCVLLIASLYVLANLLADLLGLWLDPRQRQS